jgi:Amt family ammonium transporter
MDKVKIDYPVGVISVQGVVGMWGLPAVPLSNTGATFGVLICDLVVIPAWTFIMSFAGWLILKATMGVPVSE